MKNLASYNILLASGKLDDSKEFWMTQLSGTYHSLDFPAYFSSKAEQLPESSEITLQFPAHISERILAISNGSDQRLFTILLCGFGFVLHKYTQHDDVHIGTAIFKQEEGRSDINTVLPLILRMSQKLSYRQLLYDTHQQWTEAIEHQNYDVLALIDQLYVIDRDRKTPFFEATCLFEGLHDPTYLDQVSSDLRATFYKEHNSLYIRLGFDPNLYQLAIVERFCSHMLSWYNHVLADPDLPLSEIELLSMEEMQAMLSMNDNGIPFPSEQPYNCLFELQVKRTPHRIAIMDGTQQLTYQQLNERANQLARYLIDRGFRRGEKLGIYMRSVESLITMIAIFKCGGAYVPIDPNYPLQRIAYIVNKSGISGIVTSAHMMEKAQIPYEISKSLSYSFCFGTDDDQFIQYATDDLELQGNGSDLAYMIFTSGTTGQPKGVMVHHRGMVNHIYAKINALELKQEDIVAQTASLSFDISVWQYLAILLTGGAVRVIDTDTVMDVEALLRTLQQSGATIAEMVPSLLRELLNYVERIQLDSTGRLPTLRYLMVTGEPLTVTLSKRWFIQYPLIPLVNAYGPTEASDDITHHVMSKLADTDQSTIPIGMPIQNTAIYVLDSMMRLCPIGVKGEICVAGPGVGYGYYGDEERTRHAFVSNPYSYMHSDLHYKLLYRTGDLGTINEAGVLEYYGRLDDQIKIRGYRIELGEIEHTLGTHPSIREVAVIACNSEEADLYLCAYVVSEYELNRSDIRDYLLAMLPEYMVPSHYVELNNLPLNTNGKLDRFSLPQPQRTDAAVNGKIINRSLSRTEAIVMRIWGKVLGLNDDDISLRDDFFGLGGHSLKLNQLQMEISIQCGVDIKVSELFRNPTIETMAQMIEQAEKTSLPLPSSEERTYYPVTPAQQKLFIRQQVSPADTSFHISGVRNITGSLDRRKLEQAFQKLVDRHEAFRTSFDFIDDEVVQLIAPTLLFEVERYQVEQDVVDAVIEAFIRPFDLTCYPLFRVGLIELTTEHYVLMMDMHHIISDGLSIDILIDDFAKLYGGADLPEIHLQQKDFAVWQQRALRSNAFDEQLAYWSDILHTPVPPLAIPSDYKREEKLTYTADTIDFVYQIEPSWSLEHYILRERTTMFLLLLSIYNLLLHKYSGQSDIVVGTPTSVRKFSEFQNVIGMFINTLPLRDQLSENVTFRSYLAQVAQRALAALDMADVPIELISPYASEGGTNLFDAMFVFHNRSNAEGIIVIEGMEFRNAPLHAHTAKVDWHLESYYDTDQLIFRLDYNSELYRRETAQQMANDFLALFIQVLDNPQLQVGDLSIQRNISFLLEPDLDWDFEL